MEFYDYQVFAMNAVVAALREFGRALMVMASGLGKTVTAAGVVRELRVEGKVLFLCHDTEILRQSQKEFEKVFGGNLTSGFFVGYEKSYEEVGILFATFQTMREWKDVFLKNEFEVILIDESHHGQAPTFLDVIEYFEPKYLFGFTATPDRGDEKDIRDLFGEEVVNISVEEAIAKGWLTSLRYEQISDDLNQRAFNRLVAEFGAGKRITRKQLNETVFIRRRDEEIAREVSVRAKGRKVIVFCESIAHVRNFFEYVRMYGSVAEYHSGQSKGAQEASLRLFRSGMVKYLLVVNKCNEGVDVPDAEVAVFLRSTDSLTVFLQQLGRILRKSVGKEYALILDFVANCERLLAVKKMFDRVVEYSPVDVDRSMMHVSGEDFDFTFSLEIIDILDLLNRIDKFDRWSVMFERLVAFKKEFEHVNVPHCYESDQSLANWCATQRKLFNEGRLLQDRIERLEDLGFVWGVYEARWDQNYSKLLEFKEEFEHVNVPYDFKKDRGLGFWCSAQRQAFREGRLSEGRIKKLDDLGFVWDGAAVFWERNFEALVLFKKKNGHVSVLKRHESDLALVSWSNNQRSARKAGRLSASKVKRLDELGFVWDLLEAEWGEVYSRLVEFKEVNGHADVSYRFELDRALGEWCCYQREDYKSGRMLPSRVKRLNELGFIWNLRDVKWNKCYLELVDFKGREGHANVPQRCASDKKLGAWCNTQRKSYKNGRLSQERIEKLERIGFLWKVRG